MKRDHEDLHAALRESKPTAWQALANCNGVPPGLFFPAQGDMTAGREAKRVCAGCTVSADCLAYSNTEPVELDGVWGGRTSTERRDIRMGRSVRRLA